MSVDPRDPAAVAEVVRARCQERHGPTAVVEAGTTAGGLDSHVHLVRFSGASLPAEWRAPLVVRVLPTADRSAQAHREAAAQGWAAELGYRAPRVLDVLEPTDGLDLPAQVMERAPGATMLAALTARPWQALRLTDRLAGLHLALHALPTDAWPAEADGPTLVEKRLSLPRRIAAELGLADLAATTERVAELAALRTGPEVVCHGDLHPLNVLIDGDAATVIDWTDAGLGPREADVARAALLLRVAWIVAGGRVEATALKVVGPVLSRRFLRTYRRGGELDPARLRAWSAAHAVHGWAQVAALHAGAFDGETSAGPASVPAGVVSTLRRWIDVALTGG